MPTSVPGAFNWPPALLRRNPIPKGWRGFTLIEILVVMMLMGLSIGLVSAIVAPDDRAILRVEAERLARLLELATEESHLTGKTMAWTAETGRYFFWRQRGDAMGDNGEWSEIRDSDLFRPRTLPPGMGITALTVEGLPAQGARRLEFRPYGAPQAFAIGIALGSAHYRVQASAMGEVTVMAEEGIPGGDLSRQ